MQENRPNPDELLKKLQSEESEKSAAKTNKGRLKIFLGFCAGVGKTYRMLLEANSAKNNSIDVVVGVVETHGRKETQELLGELEVIPKKKINYQDLNLEEMDIDAILDRKPKLVLVDELAHTNVPTSRHNKLYQDVDELLNSRIDVYTTLNIQHVESLIDIVYQISYVNVDETVPDRILQQADEIELVDLPAEKLLERLNEGKVYVPTKAKQAMKNFFRKGNLLALRELALKYTAKKVDIDLLSYKKTHLIQSTWAVGSRLLLGVSSSPNSEKLIRITHRMAEDLDAEWFAVTVDSPQQVEMTEKARIQLDKNIKLAEELGAKVFHLSGNIIADEIIRFAKQKNVTLIIAGLSHRSRFEEFFKGSVLNELVKKSGSINVLIVGSDKPGTINTAKYQVAKKQDLRPYLYSLFYIAITAIIGWFLKNWIDPVNVGMLLLIPVIASGILWGIRVSIFASIVAVGVFDFFFIPPFLTFRVSDLKYIPSFLVFIAVSVIISLLTKLVRWQADNARRREYLISTMYSFSRDMMQSENLPDLLNKAESIISEAFESNALILLPDENNNLIPITIKKMEIFSESQKAVASWVYKNGQPAGKGTNTLSSEEWHYVPLKNKDKTIGVICLQEPRNLTSEQLHLLESFANILSLSLLRLR